MQIPIRKPAIRRKEMDSVLSCMVGDKIGSSQKLQELCKWFEDECRLKGSFGLREYKRSIEMAFSSFQLEKGAVVLVSPFAHRYYYDVAKDMGYSVVCLDVASQSPLMNLSLVEELEEKPALIVIEHALGWMYDLEEVENLSLPVLEDITSALGSERNDIKVGSLGDVVVLRMEESDPITAGGGALLGFRGKKKFDIVKRLLADFDSDLLLTDMNASLALSLTKLYVEALQLSRELFQVLQRASLKTGNRTFSLLEEKQSSCSHFPLIVQNSVKDAIQLGRKKNVEIRLAFFNIVLERIEDPKGLENASSLALRTVLLPLYPAIGKKNLEIVAKVVSAIP